MYRVSVLGTRLLLRDQKRPNNKKTKTVISPGKVTPRRYMSVSTGPNDWLRC